MPEMEVVTKVWIAPGCIVCDACETECPDVFDVTEDSCLIRPEAESPDFTIPLTQSIKDAAVGCPVDVIKFTEEKREVSEEVAKGSAAPVAAAAASHGPAKPKVKSPEQLAKEREEQLAARRARASSLRPAALSMLALRGPMAADLKYAPDPTRRRDDNTEPAEAQIAAAMVTAGTRSIARGEPISDRGITSRLLSTASTFGAVKPAVADAEEGVTRRGFGLLAIGWTCMAAVGLVWALYLQRFLVPNILKEPNPKFRAGPLSKFSEPGVYEDFKMTERVWLVHTKAGELVALSTICTHLGCTPNYLASDQKFKCPCHGSGFRENGINFEGPAPRPLERFNIFVNKGEVMVDRSKKYQMELGQWSDPSSYVKLA